MSFGRIYFLSKNIKQENGKALQKNTCLFYKDSIK